jgi:hypothetical protein
MGPCSHSRVLSTYSHCIDHPVLSACEPDLKAEERKRKNRKLREELTKEYRMIKPRLFRYRISGIVLNPEEKIFSCFMHFSIGGLEKEVTTEYGGNKFGSPFYNSDV